MKFALYCKCGAGTEGEILPDSKAEEWIALWSTMHQGPGHGSCDKATARKAEREAERKVAKEKR